MGKIKIDQKGFGALEGLLIVIIIGMVGAIGWYVYHSLQNTNNAYSAATTTSNNVSPKFKKSTTKTSAADLTASWTTVTSPDGSFTFKQPQSWVSLTCDTSVSGFSIVYIASDNNKLAVCQSDNTGEANLGVQSDNTAASAPQKRVQDKSFSYTSFILNGVKGYKSVEVTNGTAGSLSNAKIITYSFYTKNKSFSADYRQPSGSKDESATFEQIVKTWKF